MGADSGGSKALGDPPPDPLGFNALVPIPKGEKNRAALKPPLFGLGPWVGARVGSHRCPILRPGQKELYHAAFGSGIGNGAKGLRPWQVIQKTDRGLAP